MSTLYAVAAKTADMIKYLGVEWNNYGFNIVYDKYRKWLVHPTHSSDELSMPCI